MILAAYTHLKTDVQRSDKVLIFGGRGTAPERMDMEVVEVEPHPRGTGEAQS